MINHKKKHPEDINPVLKSHLKHVTDLRTDSFVAVTTIVLGAGSDVMAVIGWFEPFVSNCLKVLLTNGSHIYQTQLFEHLLE